MTGFFDIEWTKDEADQVRHTQRLLSSGDAGMLSSLRGVFLACVVTARGRKLSPSGVLERLAASKNRTNGYVTGRLQEAWNILADVTVVASERVNSLVSLINPRHWNKTGVSETLRYQLSQTYEAFADLWVTAADTMVGIRLLMVRVFGMVGVTDADAYLVRGMTRSQLLKAFGQELEES